MEKQSLDHFPGNEQLNSNREIDDFSSLKKNIPHISLLITFIKQLYTKKYLLASGCVSSHAYSIKSTYYFIKNLYWISKKKRSIILRLTIN